MRLLRCWPVAGLLPILFPVCASAHTDRTPVPIVIDAAQPVSAPGPADFSGGTSVNPRGDSLGLNDRYLTLNGKPWLPVMGEFHFSRVPEAQWEEEILKMKAAGIQIIATYVIWIHHEEVKGDFDWTGQRDLRRFVELCAKHGMYVYPRIGPWAHGEVRNGGFPDWLLQETKNTRSNDPVYLGYVTTWYAQIGQQLHGLLWKDGGPVIGIQLENEYSRRGPGAGDAHILELKKLALASGLDVPLYSVTGWDKAVVPRGAVVAVFGGYPDAPWDSSLDKLPAQEVYAFRFGSRASAQMGAIGPAQHAGEAGSYRFPFITAEMGGGVEDTYHRRPVIEPDDVAAMMPVMLGSGVNLYGTYMFQGGENPDGRLTTLQESQATGYPTDVPVKSYDFQAPLSEFGVERELFRKLKVFDYFLNEFGSVLAPMVSLPPETLPNSPRDLSVARVALRTNGDSGFLFFNNYARNYRMPDRPRFQVAVHLPHRTLTLPDKPILLPSGSYGIWPFGLQIGSVHLRYATVQLFTRISSPSGETFYFVALPGVPAEFSIEAALGERIDTRGRRQRVAGAILVTDLQPALQPAIVVRDAAGRTTRIVLLSQQQAEDAWRLATPAEHLLFTHQQFFSDGQSVHLEEIGSSRFEATVVPPVALPRFGHAVAQQRSSVSSDFKFKLPSAPGAITIRQIQKARVVPQPPLGPPLPWRPHGVAMAPGDQEFSLAAKWKIDIPPADWSGVYNLFLRLAYDGDVARLTSGGKLLDDHFYNGRPWIVGLDRFRAQIEKDGLELEVLPRRADAPVFLEPRYRDKQRSRQILRLRSITLQPKYLLRFDLAVAAESGDH